MLGMAAVAILTLSVLAQATITFTTARAMVVTYNLAAGASSAPITPASDIPVLVMGNQTNPGNRGVGFAHMLHAPGLFLQWIGEDASSPNPGIQTGFSGAAGTHIIFLDFDGLVDLEVASANTFLIKNSAGFASAGEVTLMW
jgi:hypothetical protein